MEYFARKWWEKTTEYKRGKKHEQKSTWNQYKTVRKSVLNKSTAKLQKAVWANKDSYKNRQQLKSERGKKNEAVWWNWPSQTHGWKMTSWDINKTTGYREATLLTVHLIILDCKAENFFPWTPSQSTTNILYSACLILFCIEIGGGTPSRQKTLIQKVFQVKLRS